MLHQSSASALGCLRKRVRPGLEHRRRDFEDTEAFDRIAAAFPDAAVLVAGIVQLTVRAADKTAVARGCNGTGPRPECVADLYRRPDWRNRHSLQADACIPYAYKDLISTSKVHLSISFPIIGDIRVGPYNVN